MKTFFTFPDTNVFTKTVTCGAKKHAKVDTDSCGKNGEFSGAK